MSSAMVIPKICVPSEAFDFSPEGRSRSALLEVDAFWSVRPRLGAICDFSMTRGYSLPEPPLIVVRFT
jgi:hypothetical protein